MRAAAVVAGLTVFAALAAAVVLSAPEPLHYLEASSGLKPPTFEGGATEFEMADVDQDGHIDLVSVGDHGNPLINTDEEGIMVWLGDGLGQWSWRHYGHLGYGGVAVGDVNGDGTPDVGYGVHHNYSGTDLGDQKLEVALGDGSGEFWTAWDDSLADEGQSWGMFASDFADVDADGDLDIGSMGFGSSDGMHVYLNSGDGSWDRSFGFLEGNSNHTFDFGDVDGDGHADIVTSKQEGTVWLGDGEGFFEVSDLNLPPLPAFGTRPGTSLGDVDGDGRDDLAYCDDTGEPRVWLRRDAAWSDASGGLPAVGICQRTQLHDMDGDGSVDLVVAGEGQVMVFAGDGAGVVWTEVSSFGTDDNPGSFEAFRVGGDVDHNGRADMVTVDSKRVSLFEDENQVRCFRESTPAAELSVRVVSPGPHRHLLAGAAGFIDWASSVPSSGSSEPGTATIEFSSDGAGGPWATIAAGQPNSGRYQWRVPVAISEECYLRITVSTTAGQVSAVSDAPFSITRRPDPLSLQFSSKEDLSWTDDLSRGRHNLYRGDWQAFLQGAGYTQDPSSSDPAERFCDLESMTLTDPFVPAAGQLAYYLVTGYRMMEDGQEPGVPVPMAEGHLGQDSAAHMRPNENSCPR